jgi:hypothetical protein
MIKIYFKILAFTLPAIIAVIVSCEMFSESFVDYYYAKITHEGKSLIIGTSRASQGLIPDSLMKGTKFDGPMLNFAFSSFESAFDEGYFNAIKEKLDDNIKNGLFIIEIDPAAIYIDASIPSSKKLSSQIIFHGNPNYEYMYRNINPFYQIIERRNFRDDKSIQHPSGWMEVTLPVDSISVNLRSKAKLKVALESFPKCTLSENRIHYLKETIRLLKNHGTVMLIKIPAWQPIQDVENTHSPNLNNLMHQIANEMNIKYYDFSQYCKNYSYTDGNHLDKTSTIKFSSELNKIILNNE